MADVHAYSDIEMHEDELIDDAGSSPSPCAAGGATNPRTSSASKLTRDKAIFVSCRHLHLATPDATVNLPSQSMQRGLAYAKNMLQKQAGIPDFAGYSIAQVTIANPDGHPCVVRSVPVKGPNPIYVVGIALPLSLDLTHATCVIEIVASPPNSESQSKSAKPLTILASTAAFPAVQLESVSSVSVPLTAHIPTNPVDSNTPCVEVQHAPVLPALLYPSATLPFERTASTTYAFPGAVFVQEDVFETDLATTVPRQVLEMAADETEHQAAAFSSLRAASRVQECLFVSPAEAIDNGCDVFSIHALRARGLGSVPASTTSTAQHLSSSSAPTGSRASVVAMAKSMKSSAFSKLKSLQISTTAVEKATPINAYCEVTISDPHTYTGAPWSVAKTNVITNSVEPLWRIAHTGTKVRGIVDADGCLTFYRPANNTRDGFVECKVYTKPPPPTTMSSALLSARKALPHPCLGTVKIPLESLLTSETAVNTVATVAGEWYRLHQPSTQEGSACKCDDDETGDGPCVGELLIDLRLTSTSTLFPAVAPLAPSPPRYRWLDTLVVTKEPSAPIALPSRFLDDHIAALQASLETCTEARAVAMEWTIQHMRFKSSLIKKNENVQALPTNLHVAIAQVATDDDNIRVLPTVTCGLPAAHALGLEDTNLWALEEAIIEASTLLRTRLVAGHPSSTACCPLALRADGFAAVPAENPEAPEADVTDTESKDDVPRDDDGSSIKARAAKSLKERSKMLSSLYSQAKTKAIALAKAPAVDDGSTPASLVALVTRLADLRLEYRLRKAMVLSQALPGLIAAFFVSLQECLLLPTDAQCVRWEQWRRYGYLCGWESLVSSQGKELNMLLDAWMALQSITRAFTFQIVPTAVASAVTIVDTVIQIPLPPADYSRLPPALQHDAIAIVCLLFTQGINEMQSLANISNMAGVSRQSVINTSSLKTLEQYVAQTGTADGTISALRAAVATENGAAKNTEILHLASTTVRGLHGGRVTCCKSGKDRTAMSVSWEQAAWALQTTENLDQAEADVVEASDVLKMANVMREFGGRIHIAEKNVGAKRYSFNALQRKLLPPMYRPPLSTIQDMVTSVALRDS
ncbi:inositol-3,4-bisphosphate 4-phosphatase [Achlya hypogyna]|uniref:Inositol-3,4-bisphosphate 4-phosphatase n=1 Tax=Achlya hypogyna TaxID=1202772 RepID=A0A1V9YWI9_ACHHY|nr:inositol-3,4-bisphosphate 4-phosphatase [Achlya hypogyna]